MEDQKQINIRIRLKKVGIVQFSYKEIFIPDEETDKIIFNHQGNIHFDAINNFASVVLNIDITHPSLQNENFASIVTKTEYEILDTENLKTDKGYILPKNLVITLLSIAYSTTRGILLEKGAGTILSKSPLPIIDPTTLGIK